MIPRTCCHHSAELTGWILPTATLALLPKCPACVAAYIALATGMGISISTASYLRTSLIIVSFSLLVLLATRRAIRWSTRRKPSAR